MVFRSIADLNSIPADDKEGQLNNFVELSNQVGTTGFEPATPTSRTWYATGLRYVPFQKRITKVGISGY